MDGLKVAVIADAGQVQKFALDAIDAVEGCDEITVFSCGNTHTKKRAIRHGLYYALNLVTVRNAWTRWLPVTASAKRIAETVEFESEYEGAWQRLPKAIVDRLRGDGYDVILKFGMGLLRVPPAEELPAPILSFHHGDPDRYRGRPAGFWEILDGTPVLGQIVQVIGNKLDAGMVVAYGETKVYPHSYRKTLIEAYRHSPLIVNRAIQNAVRRHYLDKPCTGRNYRLPSNFAVARFVLKIVARFAHRLAYGALFEKKWQVSTAAAPGVGAASLFEGDAFPKRPSWQTLRTANGYSFYADPFYSADPPALLVEALNPRTGLGELVAIEGSSHRRVSDWAGHASYPGTIHVEGRQIIVPEIASFSTPAAFALENGGLRKLFELDLPGAPHVSDPTLVEHDGRIYLFGTNSQVGTNALFLWSADRIDGPFAQHPMSPVRISPEGSRMGGSIIRDGGRLIRLGQDFRFGYGDGLCAFEISELSADRYSETMIGTLRFGGPRGPHTLNSRQGELLFDHYDDKFAPLAGYRRLLAKLKHRASAE